VVRCTPRSPPPTVTWAKTGAIYGRIVRSFVETSVICGKTTETFGPTDRIFVQMKVPCGKGGNSCNRMSTLGPVPPSSNRIGRISVRTDKVFKAIVRIYELIAKTGEEIVGMFEPIAGIYIRIGRT